MKLNFTLDPTNPNWINTGLEVKAGVPISITVPLSLIKWGGGGGRWSYPEGSYVMDGVEGAIIPDGYYQPDEVIDTNDSIGGANRKALGCPCFSIVYCVFPEGVTPPYQVAVGVAHRTLRQTSFTPEIDGVVWIAYNDYQPYFGDNTGLVEIELGDDCSHAVGRFMSDELEEEFKKTHGRIAFLMAIESEYDEPEGYTSFDSPLTFPAIRDEHDEHEMVPALTYQTQVSVLPTEIPQLVGGSEDNVDIVTGLDMVRRIAWENEKYRNATVTLMACKWSNIDAGVVILFSGKIGKGTLTDENVKFELRPWVTLLQRNLLRIVAPICDCPLFARGRCAGNGEDPSAPQIADRTVTTTITSVTDTSEFQVAATGKDNGWANFGRAYFITGQNAKAYPRVVKKFTVAGVTKVLMANEFPFPIQVGDQLKIEEGCDRTFSMCIAKGNKNNFQAFPFVPGQQGTIKRYKVAGTASGGGGES